MLTLKFAHNYPKLHNQRTAVLVKIVVRPARHLTQKFLNYDTLHYVVEKPGGRTIPAYFQLRGDKFLVLYFIGDSLIPFTTVREYNEFRHRYYTKGLGKEFEIKYG